MTVSHVPRLLFAVPRGFEDVAAQDILRFLPVRPDHIEARNDTGLVALCFTSGEALQACLQSYDEGVCWAVHGASLEIGEPLQLSAELCDRLTVERKALPSKRSRYIKEEAASKKRLRARVEPLVEKQTTASEETVLRLIKEMVEARHGEFEQALAIWTAFKGNDKDQYPASFALRFERRDFLFPTLTSKDLARQAGGDVYDLLCRLSGQPKQKVDLTSPDLEVRPCQPALQPLTDIWMAGSDRHSTWAHASNALSSGLQHRTSTS